MTYAAETTVPFERSVGEIVAMLKQAGAAQIAQMDDDAFYAVQFKLEHRLIRFRLPLPSLADMPLVDGRGAKLPADKRVARLAQQVRSRGRALMLVVKAKLESVESGIETVEQAFLANVVCADGLTIYERVAEPLALEYATGAPNVAGFLGGPAR